MRSTVARTSRSLPPQLYAAAQRHLDSADINYQALLLQRHACDDHIRQLTPYFTIIPASCRLEIDNVNDTEAHGCTDGFSETAYQVDRSTDIVSNKTMSSTSQFMQRQTAAAHYQLPPPPRARPIQNVLQVTDKNSQDTTSDSSDDGWPSAEPTMISPPELARCSRCQRDPSIDIYTRRTDMIQYGLNLWYCNRCAVKVGFKTG